MAAQPIPSEITGTIAQVLVQVGDQVDEDTPLVMVESMKMEIPVLAPRAGRVTEVCVAPGDAVGEGDRVASIE